jgi:hypothetical protein
MNSPVRRANNVIGSTGRRTRGCTAAARRRRRQRVAFADAQVVRERVEAAAGCLPLRGARRQVLAAALKLLCGWSRITDDQIGLTQVVELIAASGGRRYDLKTVGRALASLAADELLVYRAAQGRGNRAFLGIHSRFLDGISILDRDRSGRVIIGSTAPDSVTFSGRLPYKNQTHYLPTLRDGSSPQGTRPTGVEVSTQELKFVLRALPEPMRRLPRHLRWMLGREIRDRLKAGWTPEQLLEVLGAPMPADVQRPWRLALWRLRHNVIGAGPRLRPLQRAWDAHAAAAEKGAAADATARWYSDVCAVTSPDQRAQILTAHEVRFGRRPTDPVAAIAGAGRRVARLFPQVSLAAALARWVSDVGGGRSEVAKVNEVAPRGNSDLNVELAIGDVDCLVCGGRHATARPELPLMSMVCDHCWPVIAADLRSGDGRTDAAVAA